MWSGWGEGGGRDRANLSFCQYVDLRVPLCGFFFAFWESMSSFFTWKSTPQHPLLIFAGPGRCCFDDCFCWQLAAINCHQPEVFWHFLPPHLVVVNVLVVFCIFLLQYGAKAGPQFATLMHWKWVLCPHFFVFFVRWPPYFFLFICQHLFYVFSFSVWRVNAWHLFLYQDVNVLAFIAIATMVFLPVCGDFSYFAGKIMFLMIVFLGCCRLPPTRGVFCIFNNQPTFFPMLTSFFPGCCQGFLFFPFKDFSFLYFPMSLRRGIFAIHHLDIWWSQCNLQWSWQAGQ